MSAPAGGNAGEDWTSQEAKEIITQLGLMLRANGYLLSNLPDNLQGMETMQQAGLTLYNSLKVVISQTLQPIQHFITNNDKNYLNDSWLQFTQFYQARVAPEGYNAHSDLLFRGGRRRTRTSKTKCKQRL
jgi:hypothetical protein